MYCKSIQSITYLHAYLLTYVLTYVLTYLLTYLGTYLRTYRAHEGVQHTNCKCCTTSKRLGHVQLCIRVILIILIQELYIRIIS